MGQDETTRSLVTINHFSEMTGVSAYSIRGKIRDGKWLKDIHYYKRDGRIMLDYDKIMQWYQEENPTC